MLIFVAYIRKADFVSFLSGICVGVVGLVLVAVVILIVYAVYRSRRNPPVPTEEPEDAPLKEFTFTVSNTPGERQPETIGGIFTNDSC